MKAIILARVSTQEQKEAGNSLPAQVFRLKDYTERTPNLELDKEFTFDESAYKEGRQKFDDVINYLEQQKELVSLCCDKVYRLARDFLVGLPKIEKLRREGKIELHFPGDNLVLTENSPATDLFHFNIAVSLAQYYSNAISDNTKRAMEEKIRKGEWIGQAPVGYLNLLDDKEKRTLILDCDREHLVHKSFKLYATGTHSVKTIQKEMKKLGLRHHRSEKVLSNSSIHKMLKNPFYYGVMRVKGQEYPHIYEPIITKHLFDKCQEVMASYKKSSAKKAAKPFSLKGILTCAQCGCTITAELKKGRYTYYSCTNGKGTCKRIYVREEELLEHVYKLLKGLRLPDDAISYLKIELKRTEDSEQLFHKNNMKALKTQYDRIETRVSKMYDDKLDGGITTEMYDKKLKEYKSEQKELLDEMQKHNYADESFYSAASTLLDVASRAYEIFDSSEPLEKQTLLGFLLQNSLLDGKKLTLKLKEPFNLLQKINLEQNEKPAYSADHSVWLRGRDSNPRPID